MSERLLSAHPEPINVSPDGRRILLKSRHLDSFELQVMEGAPARTTSLLTSPHSQFSLTWTPAGDKLVYQEFLPEEGSRGLFLVDLATRMRKRLSLPSSQSSIAPLRFSPDGRRLAYFVHDKKRRLLVTEPTADPPPALIDRLEPRGWRGCRLAKPGPRSCEVRPRRRLARRCARPGRCAPRRGDYWPDLRWRRLSSVARWRSR